MTTLILATQRTGSTLLCSEFEDIGGLGRPGEHVLPWLRDNAEDARLDPVALTAILSRGRDDGGRLGLKLMADYLPRVGRALGARDAEPLAQALFAIRHIEAVAGRAAIFRLDRLDVFDQALSSYLATATGLFFRTADGEVTDAAMTREASHEAALAAFDGRLFDTYVVQVERDKAFLAELCAGLDRPVLGIAYEDLVERRAATLARCCAHAGVPCPDTLPRRWMRKVVDPTVRDRFRTAAERFWQERARQGRSVPAIAQTAIADTAG